MEVDLWLVPCVEMFVCRCAMRFDGLGVHEVSMVEKGSPGAGVPVSQGRP